MDGASESLSENALQKVVEILLHYIMCVLIHPKCVAVSVYVLVNNCICLK